MNSALVSLSAPGEATPVTCRRPASADTFEDLVYWQAADYLTLGQLYLRDNPLLVTRLVPADLKRRPAGPWRHAALTNLLYTQLNRICRTEPFHGCLVAAPSSATPALLANLWLDGTYAERVPGATRDRAGMVRLFGSFGTDSAVPPELGGRVLSVGARGADDLGGGRRALLAATGAALGAPDVIALCLLSEDQAGESFAGAMPPPHGALRAGRDGLVLPVVEVDHTSDRLASLLALLVRSGLTPLVVAEDEPCMAHAAVADALAHARRAADASPGWQPALVFVTPPALSLPLGPDGAPSPATEGREITEDRLLLARAATDEREREELGDWLLSFAPDALFDADGVARPRVQRLIPPAGRRVGEGVGLRPV